MMDAGDEERGDTSDLRGRIDFLRAQNEALRADVARLEALFQQTHGCHVSWVQAGMAWQDWAATLLGSIGQQLEGGQHGDGAARTLIEGLLSSGVLHWARLKEATTEWRQRCPCACVHCQRLDEALRDVEVDGHG